MERTLYVVSFSGGLDSTTTLFKILKESQEKDTIIAVNMHYGQVNQIERVCAERIAKSITDPRFEYTEYEIDLIQQKKLTESAQVLKYYVPSRNLVMISLLASYGESIDILKYDKYDKIRIVLGLHRHSTYQEYWDITPEFVQRINKVFALNTEKNIQVYCPFVNHTKKEICKEAEQLGIDFSKTWTCYNPRQIDLITFESCGECESCIERKEHCGEERVYTRIEL